MKYFLVITAVLVVVGALPFELVEDEEGQQYLMVPTGRVKRQTKWNIESPGIGSVSHTGTIFDNNKNRLDGTGYASKDLRNLGKGGLAPDAYGGRLDYSHKPSGSSLGLGADHVRRGGTDLTASGTYNFIHNKNAEVGLTGQYGRHFGGPGGSGRPTYGVMLGGKIKF